MELTKHIRIRCQQRGIKEADLDLIVQYGTETSEGVFLTGKDVAEAERELKHLMNRIEKLKGVFVATDGDVGKTAFRPKKQQHRYGRGRGRQARPARNRWSKGRGESERRVLRPRSTSDRCIDRK